MILSRSYFLSIRFRSNHLNQHFIFLTLPPLPLSLSCFFPLLPLHNTASQRRPIHNPCGHRRQQRCANPSPMPPSMFRFGCHHVPSSSTSRLPCPTFLFCLRWLLPLAKLLEIRCPYLDLTRPIAGPPPPWPTMPLPPRHPAHYLPPPLGRSASRPSL